MILEGGKTARDRLFPMSCQKGGVTASPPRGTTEGWGMWKSISLSLSSVVIVMAGLDIMWSIWVRGARRKTRKFRVYKDDKWVGSVKHHTSYDVFSSMYTQTMSLYDGIQTRQTKTFEVSISSMHRYYHTCILSKVSLILNSLEGKIGTCKREDAMDRWQHRQVLCYLT